MCLPWYISYVCITVALYGLSAFKGLEKCINNLLRDIHICLWDKPEVQ